MISGGSGGVGKHLAQTLLDDNVHCSNKTKVSIQYNSNSSFISDFTLNSFENEIDFLPLKADVTNEDHVSSSIARAVDVFGPIDVLVVCHGIWPTADEGVKDMSYERFQNTINVNLGGTFLYVKHYLKQLEKVVAGHGENGLLPSIVLIGSTAGKFGEAFHSDYSASKSALMTGFTLSVKNEIVRIHSKGRINTVSPGWIRTPMADRALQDKTLLYQAFATSPLKRVSDPSDITQAILFLADSSKSGNITGISLDVNSGMEGNLMLT